MKWSSKESQTLKRLLEEGKTLKECAFILGRGYDSIEKKSRKIKFTRPSPKTIEENVVTIDFPQGKLKPAAKQKLLDTYAPLVVDTLRQNIFESKPYTYKQTGLHEEDAVLVLSDMHTGMLNEIYDPTTQQRLVTYNEEIRQREAVYLRDSVFSIHDILSKSYKLKKLHILILGDMITNDRIFDGQQFEIDRPYGKQVWDTVRDLTYFINQMKDRFEQIHVIGVVGNHGRSNFSYEEPVENNFEWTLYKIIQQTFSKDKRVEIEVPNTRFYSTDIKGFKYYMSHGDSMRGTSRSNVDRAAKDLLTTLMPDLPQGFDVYMIGHFHGAEKMDLNEKSTLIINGSWIPRDQYGYKMFRRYSKPQQWFFGVSNSRPITWSYALDLKGILK